MLKIILNATLLEQTLTGIGQYQWNVIEQLSLAKNVKNKVVLNKKFINSSKGKELINLVKKNNGDTEIIEAPSSKNMYRLYSLLGRYLEDGFIYHDLSFNSALGKKTKAKVVTFHDAFFLDRKLWTEQKGIAALNAKYILPWSARNADHLLVQTHVVKELLVSGLALDSNRITVIPMGNPREGIKNIDRKTRKNNLIIQGKRIDKPFVLCVGAGHKRKRTVDLIQASAQVNTDHLLVITGKEVLNEPGVAAAVEGKKNIIILGYVSDQDLIQLYENAEALFFPSEEEGFGFPIIEALSYELPVFASELPVFKEVGGEFVSYFQIGNINEIKVNIERALSKRPEAYYDTEKLEKWLKQFTWENYGENLIDLYHRLSN